MIKSTLLVSLLLVTSSAFAIIGGREAIEGEGQGVFQIIVYDQYKPELNRLCTATKISSTAFISAAHCFDLRPVPTSVGLNSKIKNPAFEYSKLEIDKINIHPSFNGSYSASMIDVAIITVKFSSEFEQLETRDLDFNLLEPGSKIDFWGFGCQNKLNDSNGYMPVKKTSSNTVQVKSRLQGNFGELTTSIHHNIEMIYQNSFMSAGLNISSRGASVCQGDSGGPVFRDGYLVGINYGYFSRDLKMDGTSKTGKTDLNLHARLSVIQDWIEESLGP